MDKKFIKKTNKLIRDKRPYFPTNELCATFQSGNLLEIGVLSKQCKNDLTGSCLMCDYGRASNTGKTQDYLDEIQIMLNNHNRNIKFLLLCTNGSFLDEYQIPNELLIEILKKAQDSDIPNIIIETHYRDVTTNKLNLIKSIVHKPVTIEMGLETVNKDYQNAFFMKGVEMERYEETIHPNLCIEKNIFNSIDIDNHMLELKIMLLSHGITISEEAKLFLDRTSGINYEEFSAIDLILDNKYYINVPYQTNLSELSPFEIKIINNQLFLFYRNSRLKPAVVRGIDPIANHFSKNGIMYSDFSYLGNDRLRINHRLGCFYKQKSCSCNFCDLDDNNRNIDLEDIKEAIDEYGNCNNINHYLIGGGSNSIDDDFRFVCTIAKYLKQKSNKHINLMSLPIKDKTILNNLKESGVTEVTFNIEVYDRNLAKLYMPGKGRIELNTYLVALKNSVEIWGNTGNVRTIFIVGLESKSSLLQGIEEVCKIGVSPILSLFKPIEGTPLSYILPPSDEEILDIVTQAENICRKYKIQLGPSCSFCEDNTLKITR